MRKITSRSELYLRPSIDYLFKDLEDLEIFFREKVLYLILGGGYYNFDEIDCFQACEDFLRETETVWYLVQNGVIFEIFPNKIGEDNMTGEFLHILIYNNEEAIINIYESL